MKNMKKIALAVAILLMSVIFIPNFASAENKTVATEEDLINAIDTAESGDTIELTADIKLSKPLEFTGKTLTIDGNNHTITKDDDWTNVGSNGTLITVGSGAKGTLRNLTLTGSEKYGVQAYNSGYVVLDNVTIKDNKFGGVLVNAGTLEIVSVNLGKNGETDNVGIEISKGDSITEDINPEIVMNGTISSTQDKNVIYIAENDKNLNGFEITNREDSPQKILVQGDKAVVTDEENNIIYESNSNPEVSIEGEKLPEEITVTVKLNDKTTTKKFAKGTTITREDLEKEIDLADLDLADYTLVDFYSDSKFETKFDFTKELTEDTTIYAKLDAKKVDDEKKDDEKDDKKDDNKTTDKKDETPKTGVNNTLLFIVSGVALSTIAVLIVKRKELNM